MDIDGVEDNPIAGDVRPVRATNDEMEARVEYTAMMLIDGRRKSEIKRFFRENYSLSARQVERYLRLARNMLVEETDRTRQELIAESFGFYMRILHDDNASVNERLNARSKADDLMGLQAPKRIIEAHVQTDDILDLWVDNLTVEQKEAINEAAIYAERVESLSADEATAEREESYRTLATTSEDERDTTIESEDE